MCQEGCSWSSKEGHSPPDLLTGTESGQECTGGLVSAQLLPGHGASWIRPRCSYMWALIHVNYFFWIPFTPTHTSNIPYAFF